MAKAEKIKLASAKIFNTDEADETLARIAMWQDKIAEIEIEERSIIAAANARMVERTAQFRRNIEVDEVALEQWARTDRATLFLPGTKILELTRGAVGFRLPRGRIKLLLAVENIIGKLKAKRMTDCIRTTEEPNLERLWNYDDERLAEVGCRRTKPKEKFYYELKKAEVK